MKTTAVSLVFAAVLVGVARGHDPGVPYAEVVAVTPGTTDNVVVRPSGFPEPPPRVGTKLLEGDAIRTGDEASVTLQLKLVEDKLAKLAMTIQGNSELSPAKLLELQNQIGDEKRKYEVLLKLKEAEDGIEAEASFEIEPGNESEIKFETQTPVATASVRGTVFSISYRALPEPTTTVKVSEGLVEVTPMIPDPMNPEGDPIPNPNLDPFFLGPFEASEVTDETITDLPLPRSGILLGKAKGFPATKLRKSSRPQSVSISNAASADFLLTDLAVRTSGRAARDFKVTQPADTVLAPGESTTFRIIFSPRATGVRKARLTVSGNGSPIVGNLVGKGRG